MPYPKSRRKKAQGCLPEVGAGPRPGEFSRFVNTWDCWRIKISLEDIVELQDIVGYCIYLKTYLSLIPMDKIFFFPAASSGCCSKSPFLKLFSTCDCSATRRMEIGGLFSPG